MPQESSVPDLIQCLRYAKRKLFGPDWKKRIECARLLGELGAEEAVGDLTAVVNEKQNTDLCRTCVTALGQTGNEEAIQALARFLYLPDCQDVHAEAVLALAQIETEETGRALAEASADPAARLALLDGLRRELCKASRLMRPDWDRRAMAAEALGILHATEVVDDMVEAVSKHKEPRLWRAIIPALTLIGDDRATGGLVTSWQWADAVQSAAIRQSLISLGTERTDQLLIDGLSHQAPVVCEQAWDLLTETGILPRLMAALEDPSEEVHVRARGQAVQIGERAVTDLFEALYYETDQVRCLAASALVEIGGETVEPLRAILALWEQAAETPRTTVVASDGSGDFVTVHEAICDALPGGIIRLASGEHHLEGSLCIEKPLAVIGTGMDDSRIVGEASEILVWFNGSGPFCVIDLSFENTGSEAASVVEVADGEVGFYRCRFTGGSVGDQDIWLPDDDLLEFGDDLALAGVFQGPMLLRVPEGTVGGDGLRLLASTRGTVSKCECVRNAKVGLAVMGQATPMLKNNTCRENWAGILSHDGAAGTILRNQCRKNLLHGIQITGQANPEVRHSTCDQNGRAGIFVGDEAQPTLVANACRANKVGIAFRNRAMGTARQNQCLEHDLQGILVEGESQPTLQANICQGNLASGIAYYEAAAGSASENQCTSNGMFGIEVAGTTHPILQVNTCNGNLTAGIAVAEEAQPRLEGNICDENERFGIAVAGSAQPALHGNRCQRNEGDGLIYQERGAGTATENQLNENSNCGVQVQNEAQPTLEHNICQKNGGAGLAYFDSAGGRVLGNRCLSNEVGIVVMEQAQPNLMENICSGNQDGGIFCGSLVTVTIMRNQCLSNGESGIMIGEESQPEVVGNMCRQNQKNGIHVMDRAAGKIRQNECSSNSANGITVQDEAHPTLEENDCHRNMGNGIAYFDFAAGVARHNRCRNNEECGILLVGDFTHPDLPGNDLRGNKLGPECYHRD